MIINHVGSNPTTGIGIYNNKLYYNIYNIYNMKRTYNPSKIKRRRKLCFRVLRKKKRTRTKYLFRKILIK
ncbi:hypothetical protein [Candidatus Karelsulcia muelleri]